MFDSISSINSIDSIDSIDSIILKTNFLTGFAFCFAFFGCFNKNSMVDRNRTIHIL